MMDLPNIDRLLASATLAGHVILLIVLLRKKYYREFPVFTAFVFFAMISDPILMLWAYFSAIPSAQVTSSPGYFRLYYALQVPQHLLGLGVLVEIARNVLQPLRRSIPRGSLMIFVSLLLIAGVATYILSGHSEAATLLSRLGGMSVKMNLINATLRIVCFVVIAVFAQMLGIGWKNHVLQLTTGLAFYGAVDLIVQLWHMRLASGGNLGVYYTQFRMLDQLRVIGYLSTVTFWCWSFARKEAPRKEFSPQMARLLVSIAGVAKKDRSHLTG